MTGFQQVAMLCAKHALNMLLQGQFFREEDLGTIAQRLDEQEKSVLGEEAQRAFVSTNMDDTGFFSIGVLQTALDTFQLNLVPLENPTCAAVKANPQ